MLKHLFISFLLLKLADLTDVTYYEILGVSKQATAQEIRQAYKKLAIKYHPDKNPEAAQQEMFLKITEAYENLKDPDKRHNYDTYGKHHAHSGYGQYGYRTQADYNNLFYNGLYHDDPFVDTLSGGNYFNYLQDGFHFINFYSPFCPPCKKLSGDWKNLAKTYKGIVKVGAVNCKYYSNFCYNSMHIGSYPTLIFYPNGRKGSYVYYRGQHTMEALNDFVMAYIRKEMHVPVIAQIRNTENPIAYVLGSYRIERDSLTRIAYSLKGLVTLAIVEDDALRSKLTEDDNVAVVFKFRGRTREIESTGEREVLNEIVAALPRVQTLNPDKLKQIRDNLRSASRDDTWVIYFTKEGNDHNRLKLLQMTVAHPNMKFGEIDCDAWSELCSLLQVEDPPAWGVLKPRGGYQRVWGEQDIQAAAAAYNLQTLSISEFTRALAGDTVTWVLLVVPHKSRWEHRKEAFTKASIHYNYKDDINFGILVCTAQTDKYCRQVANDQPVIIVQRGSKRHYYLEDADSDALVEYIELLMDTTDMELSEDNILQIMDASSREHTWVVAFLPANCGQLCDRLLDQWRKVHKKLRPLEFVRVGALQCAQNTRGFCTNIRTPTARLVSLQQLSQAPYMCEWALEYVAGAVQRFSWQTFNKLVLSEDLRPTSGKSPWLVYFHSPRCFHCYEMYPDFAITGINLGNAVQLGKVNCLTERGLCQHEQITSYPSVRLYLNRNEHHKFSFAIPIPVRDHETMMREIQPHLKKYDPALKIEENLGMRSQGIHMKHDEF